MIIFALSQILNNMKRILTIFLALLIGLSTSAQLQNKLLGFTLGSTTKSEVYNKYKNDPYFFEREGGNCLVTTDVTFAGHEWDIVSFYFFNNKLAGISFSDLEPETSAQVIELTWGNLKDKLMNKYSYYLIPTSSDMILYSDGINNIALNLTDTSGRLALILYYSNRALTEGKMDAEEDEL